MKKPLLTAAALALSTAAQATVIPTLGEVTPAGGATYMYSYQGYLANDPSPARSTDYIRTPVIVPEPPAWGLILLGVGLTGAGLRGRPRITPA